MYVNLYLILACVSFGVTIISVVYLLILLSNQGKITKSDYYEHFQWRYRVFLYKKRRRTLIAQGVITPCTLSLLPPPECKFLHGVFYEYKT